MADAVLIDDVLDYLNMGTPTPADQAELGQYISAAVQTVESFCGPIIVREVTDYGVPGGSGGLVLAYRPVHSLVSLSVAGSPMNIGSYQLVPTLGLVRGAFPGGQLVDVTYRAGWAETIADVPSALALACQVIVAHLYGDQRRPTLGPQPTYTEEYPTAAAVSSGYAIPYKARDLMAPYRLVSLP